MKIAVYCGSAYGAKDIFKQKAIELVECFEKNGIDIVYGGSKSGLMGTISEEGLKRGIEVTGVITKSLAKKERVNNSVTTLYTVANIRDRKAKMSELSDGFIAMPGGYGTFEEIFEILTEHQIGYHSKPCAFYNVNGYYDKLLEFLDVTVECDFVKKRHRDMIIVSDNPDEIISRFRNYTPPKGKWEK